MSKYTTRSTSKRAQRSASPLANVVASSSRVTLPPAKRARTDPAENEVDDAAKVHEDAATQTALPPKKLPFTQYFRMVNGELVNVTKEDRPDLSADAPYEPIKPNAALVRALNAFSGDRPFHALPSHPNASNAIKTEGGPPKVKPDVSTVRHVSSLDDRYFMHAAGTTFTMVDGILRLPFNVHDNEHFIGFARERLVGSSITEKEDVRLMAEEVRAQHGMYHGESVIRKRKQKSRSRGKGSGEGKRGEDDEEMEVLATTMSSAEGKAKKERKGEYWTQDDILGMYHYPPWFKEQNAGPDEPMPKKIAKEMAGKGERSIPPWFSIQLALALRWAFDAFVEGALEVLHEEKLSVRSRKPNVKTGERSYDLPEHPEGLSLRIGLRVFGAWAVDVSEDDELEWASGPPCENVGDARGGVPTAEVIAARNKQKWYASQVKIGVKALLVRVRDAERKRMDLVERGEKAFEDRWTELAALHETREPTYEEIHDNIRSLSSDLAKVTRDVDEPLPWIDIFQRRFFDAAERFARNGDETGERPLAIIKDSLVGRARSATESSETEKQAQLLKRHRKEEREAESLHQIDAGEAEDSQLGKELLREDYGTKGLLELDAWEWVERLGLLGCQKQEAVALAGSVSKAEAHEWVYSDESDEAALPIGPGGRFIRWINPAAHEARSLVQWPGFKEFDSFGARIGDDGMVEECVASLQRMTVRLHQLVAVGNIDIRGHIDNDFSPSYFATLLADEVGLGKTWIYAMLVGLRRYRQQQRKDDPEYRCPSMQPDHEGYPAPGMTSTTADAISARKPVWVGDRRLAGFADQSRVHLMLSSSTLRAQHVVEMSRLLRPDEFAVFDYGEILNTDWKRRRRFWLDVVQAATDGRTPIVCASYPTLVADSRLCREGPGASKHSKSHLTLFNSDVVFETCFIDEIADLRNPETAAAFATRRIVERSGYAIGATATPVYTSPMDVFNICRVLGLPGIVQRAGLETEKPATDQKNGSSKGKRDADLRQKLKDLREEAVKEDEEDKAEAALGMTLKARSKPAGGRGLEVDESDPAQIDIRTEFDECFGQIQAEVIGPMRNLLQHWVIRRTHGSIQSDGLPATTIQAVDPEDVWVELDASQAAEHASLLETIPRDSRFATTARRHLKVGTPVLLGYHSETRKVWPALRACAEDIGRALKEDAGKPLAQQRKFVVYCAWTSLIRFAQLDLYKHGIASAALTGHTDVRDKVRLIKAFQSDADHPCDAIAEYGSTHTAYHGDKAVGRVMFITPAGMKGINLQRASEIHLLDPCWSFADIQQIIGRVNRYGQRFPVRARCYYHRGTCDERIYHRATAKRRDHTAFFGEGSEDDDVPDPAILTAPAIRKPNVRRSRALVLQIRSD